MKEVPNLSASQLKVQPETEIEVTTLPQPSAEEEAATQAFVAQCLATEEGREYFDLFFN